MAIILQSVGIVCQGLVVPSTGANRRVLNSFVYATPAVLGGTFLLDLLNVFQANVWNGIVAQLSVDYIGQPYLMYSPARFLPGLGVPLGGGPSGAVTGDRLPLSVAANVLCAAPLRGRHFHGNRRFGPIAESSTVKDELTPGAHAALVTAAAAIPTQLTDVNGRVWTPYVESRVLTQSVVNPLAISAEILTRVVVNKTLGFARHRREPTAR